MAEMVDIVKCSEEVFSKMKAELAKVQVDWAWKRESRVGVGEGKEGRAEMVEKFKASEDFVAERARAMADFQKSKFFALYRDFG